jgi:hypothetical protein
MSYTSEISVLHFEGDTYLYKTESGMLTKVVNKNGLNVENTEDLMNIVSRGLELEKTMEEIEEFLKN